MRYTVLSADRPAVLCHGWWWSQSQVSRTASFGFLLALLLILGACESDDSASQEAVIPEAASASSDDSEGARSDADDQQEQASQPDSSNDQDGNPGDIAVSDDGFRCALTEAVHGGFPAGGCLGFGVFVLGGGPNPAFDGLDEAGNAQLTTCYPRYGVLMVDNPDANKPRPALDDMRLDNHELEFVIEDERFVFCAVDIGLGISDLVPEARVFMVESARAFVADIGSLSCDEMHIQGCEPG